MEREMRRRENPDQISHRLQHDYRQKKTMFLTPYQDKCQSVNLIPLIICLFVVVVPAVCFCVRYISLPEMSLLQGEALIYVFLCISFCFQHRLIFPPNHFFQKFVNKLSIYTSKDLNSLNRKIIFHASLKEHFFKLLTGILFVSGELGFSILLHPTIRFKSFTFQKGLLLFY